jgi:CRP-like cAMP-binding protein
MSFSQSSTSNLLLRTLSAEDYELLQPHFEREALPLRKVLYEPGESIDRVYFIEGGVASIVTAQEGGDLVEIGLYGHEGMSGTPVILGAGQSPHRSFIQVDGPAALVIRTEVLLEACGRSSTLLTLLLRYAQTLTVQAALTAASNAHYDLPERLARWLLMCHDRVEGDRISLTHEFIANMLAVRRSGVTVTLHTLEGTGAIRSSRGLVTVIDRARLEEIAGDSYGEAEAEYRRLIGPFGKQALDRSSMGS